MIIQFCGTKNNNDIRNKYLYPKCLSLNYQITVDEFVLLSKHFLKL